MPADCADTITIDDFTKVDLRVARRWSSAEAGQGRQQAAAPEGGYRPRPSRAPLWPASPKAYQPEQLLNRKVVIVANLEPRKLRGLESQTA